MAQREKTILFANDEPSVCKVLGRRLKAMPQTAKIPVILVTAKDLNISNEQLQEIGAFAFLAKPYSATVLLRTIQRALGEA